MEAPRTLQSTLLGGLRYREEVPKQVGHLIENTFSKSLLGFQHLLGNTCNLVPAPKKNLPLLVNTVILRPTKTPEPRMQLITTSYKNLEIHLKHSAVTQSIFVLVKFQPLHVPMACAYCFQFTKMTAQNNSP